MGRIQNKYTKLEFDDTFILGEIGDEEIAREIEKLISWEIKERIDAPGKIHAARTKAIEQIRKRIKINQNEKENSKSDFDIATDSNEQQSDRVSAALRLDKNQSVILKKLLLGRIQNKYTSHEFDDTLILGEIGDEETAKELEKLCLEAINGRLDVPVKIHAARFGAIEQIRQRINDNTIEKENNKSDFEIAKDSNELWEERVSSAPGRLHHAGEARQKGKL